MDREVVLIDHSYANDFATLQMSRFGDVVHA
jgi:hypothetical protein